MKFLIVITLTVSALFSPCANAGEVSVPQQAVPRTLKDFAVDSIYFDNEDRKLYVFGHMQTKYLDEDSAPTIEEPKVIRISEDGKYEAVIDAAFFGLEHYGPSEHAHDGKTTQTWFVDTAHSRILRFTGNPESAAAAYAPLLVRGSSTECFFNPRKMPAYGFKVSIAGTPARIWAAPRTGGGGPYALARDEKNGLLWEGDEGGLRIQSDATSQPALYRPRDYASAVFPDERDGTAWVYLSHNRGELEHIDHNGNSLSKLPIAKYLTSSGPGNKIVIDFVRGRAWYADTGYPFKLVQLPLSGEPRLELDFKKISGMDYCANPSLALQQDGVVWLYCTRQGIYKLDASGRRLLLVTKGTGVELF